MLTRSQSQAKTDSDTCEVFAVDKEHIARARAALLEDSVVEDVTDLFKILSHGTRLGILRALSTGELCVCELAELLGLSLSAVSHQLRDLRRLRLVAFRMEGRLAYYSIREPFILKLLDEGVGYVTASQKARVK